MKVKNVCCIGAGYVGGPTMAVIADKCKDLSVTVVDIDVERINSWNNTDMNKLPVYEPGLDEIILRCRNKNLFFSTHVENSISKADIIFLSVNTPTKVKGIGAGEASDLKWIESSARQVATYAKGYTIVVEKSTLPVRTTIFMTGIALGRVLSIIIDGMPYPIFFFYTGIEILSALIGLRFIRGFNN